MLSEYKLVLVYPLRHGHAPQWVSHAYKDATTCATSLELLTTYGIHTSQPNATTLVFASESARTLAVLALSGAKEFTTQCV